MTAVSTALSERCVAPSRTALSEKSLSRSDLKTFSLSREPSGCANEFSAQLVSRLFLGDITLYHLSATGNKLRGKTAGTDRQLEPGSSIYVRLPAEKLKIFPK